MAKHYDKQFKLDAIQYYHDHRELGLQGCASNLGISHQTLSRWQKELRDTGDIESRGSGNYASDEAKEIALAHASVAASEAAYIKVDTDYDDGRLIYEVEFVVKSIEYEYEIDADSGNILDFDREIDD